jgi:membrane protease YdiL (CAAX protease family)
MTHAADPSREPLTGADWQAVLLALIFPTAATWAYFVLLAGSTYAQAVYASGKLLQFAFPVCWVALWHRRRLRPAAPSSSGVGQGLALGLIVVAAMMALYYGYLKTSPILASAPVEIAKKMVDFRVDSPAKYLALAAFISLLHSLLEEYYWRWFVFGQLRRSLPFAAAAVISSLGFMAHHVLVVGGFLKSYGLATWLFSLCVAVGGFLWAWIYQRTRSLYGPWLSHVAIDAGLMWLGFELWRSAG